MRRSRPATRRRRRARRSSWLLAVIAVIALAGVLQARLDLLGRFGAQECRTVLCCEECRTIGVSRVIDGDTFDTPDGRVRLFGVDTPERNERCYAEARRRLSQLAGSRVRVEPGPRHGDGNRLLFYVYTRNGESIEERLVQEGLALAWTRDGQHRDFLVGLEQSARLSGTGCLW